MHHKPKTIPTIDLHTVTGGLTTPQGMAPPKYSAGWWDFVRKSGAQQPR